MSQALIDALIASLDEQALVQLADKLAPYIISRLPAPDPQPDGWLDSAGAAAYLAISKNALHKLTAERRVPFEQDGPGCKCWFRRSDLDAWRQGDAAKTQPNASTRRLRSIA